MATIRQRGNQFEVQIRRKGWPTLSKTFPDKAAARAWVSVVESEMVRGIFVDRSEAEKNTLGDLLGRYLTEVSESKKGALSERYRIASLQRDPIAQYKVAGLSGKVLAEWRDRRLKQVTGSTTNRDLGLISHVINVARKEWGIHIDNPVAMIRRPLRARVVIVDCRHLRSNGCCSNWRRANAPKRAFTRRVGREILGYTRWLYWRSKRRCAEAKFFLCSGMTSSWRIDSCGSTTQRMVSLGTFPYQTRPTPS